jgi:hypothetical protein
MGTAPPRRMPRRGCVSWADLCKGYRFADRRWQAVGAYLQSRDEQGQSFTKFGDTWTTQYRASDDYTQKLPDILKVIENHVPSDAMIRNQRLVDATK